MIDEAIMESAIKALDGLSNNQWERAQAEVMEDEGHPYLLMSVYAPLLTEAELTTERRETINSVLSKIIPSHPDQEKFGSWMIVFKRNEKVFASVFPGPGGL